MERTQLPGRRPVPEPSPEDTHQTARAAGADPVSAEPMVRPVLGVVAIYSESAVELDPPAPEGRTYAMREGEVLFVGKAPQPEELQLDDGTHVPVTYAHLFPFTENFEYVSRRHAAVEFKPGGEIVVMDFSTNGIFLADRHEHIRRQANQKAAVHRIKGAEHLILGIDMQTQRDAKAKDRSTRHRLQLIPFGTIASSEEETRK